MPLYNIYIWYKIHIFDKPNWRVKESLILWTVFLILSFLGNVLISSSALLLIIFRISALMSDIDFINIPVKQRLNKLFFKNPEEIR
ncbi:MAG: hypothetical protein WCP92_09210 [bacterium]